MPRMCTVCAHAERAAIDRAMVARNAIPALSREYSLSEDALSRHKAIHLPLILVKAEAVREVARADDLLLQANRLYTNAVEIMDAARGAGDGDLALKAIGAAGRILALLGELLGELDRRPVVNLLLAPEWLQVRAVLLEALQPHPEARTAVSERLAALEAARNA